LFGFFHSDQAALIIIRRALRNKTIDAANPNSMLNKKRNRSRKILVSRQNISGRLRNKNKSKFVPQNSFTEHCFFQKENSFDE
jgi:hypothetical protein